MDKSRQSGLSLQDIKHDHVKRYQFVASRIGMGLKVIDVACGVGYGSQILYDAGNNVLGVDIDQDAIDHANSFFQGPSYLCADATKDNFGPRDIMISFETLEHLEKPELLLKCAQVKGLVASVPNQEKYPFKEWRFKDDKYPHFRHYTPTEFEDLLTKNGFRVEEKWCQRDSGGAVYIGTEGKFLIYCCSVL